MACTSLTTSLITTTTTTITTTIKIIIIIIKAIFSLQTLFTAPLRKRQDFSQQIGILLEFNYKL